MKKLSSLTIFFPCRNDGKILPYLLAKTYQVTPSVARRFEVVIIDNGSTDDTLQVVKTLTHHYPHLRAKHFKKPLGYGGAIRQGFMAGTNEWIFYTDGDGQYDPAELINLIGKLTSTIDVVNGYKKQRADTILRLIAGNLYNWLLHIVYALPIRDIDCDFRLIRRSRLKQISLTSNSGLIGLELVLKLSEANCTFAEVSVHHYPRAFGQSQFFRMPNILQTIREHVAFYRNWHSRN